MEFTMTIKYINIFSLKGKCKISKLYPKIYVTWNENSCIKSLIMKTTLYDDGPQIKDNQNR